MNCTKIIPPLPIFINIFYYYSYFALFLSLAITPLTFYVILKQSKNLKNFKWLILNHTFWCLLFEIFFTSIKPLFLTPAISGYPLGLLNNGNLKITAFATYFLLMVASVSMAALGATLLCRYLLVFPATKWFNIKRGIAFTIMYLSVPFIVLSVIFYPFLIIDSSEFYSMAKNYDPCLQNYFNEDGFAFFPLEMSNYGWLILFFALISVFIIGIFLALYFIFLVKTNNSATTTKLSTSLMISAIVQLSISLFIYLLPITIFFGVLSLQIPHFQNLMLINFCFISSHSFLESFATLYFVTPYRKYVIKLFYQTLSFKRLIVKKHVHVSKTSTFVGNNNFYVNR